MANGNDRTPALQNEDWWACLIGWFILLVAIIGFCRLRPNWVNGPNYRLLFPKVSVLPLEPALLCGLLYVY